MRRLAIVIPLVVAACGGHTAGGSSGDASTPAADDVPPTFLTTLRAGNDLCLPQMLASDPASGATACRVFEVPSAGPCTFPGVSDAGPTTAAFIRSHLMLGADQAVCELAQIPMSAWGGASCTEASPPGWCYVSGAAAGASCAQGLRFSPTGQPAAGAMMLLACP